MSEREISTLMHKVHKMETCADYEKENANADAIELVGDAYAE